MRKIGFMLALGVLASCMAQAGEKEMMHCFAFTPIKEATQADWDAFYKATDQWPKKFKRVKRVWAGKLRAPLAQYGTSDAAARKKVAAGENASGPLTYTRREYGVCMAIDLKGSDPAGVLKEYTANPFHKEWTEAYTKVRVAGTTTYDIIGQ